MPLLSIAPASTGSKALVVCAEGSEEASVAAGWASASRGAGAAVSVCPPNFLESHAKGSAGTYDSVVVEGGGKEGGSGVSSGVLGEVRIQYYCFCVFCCVCVFCFCSRTVVRSSRK